jgi:chromosome segregation ATPase
MQALRVTEAQQHAEAASKLTEQAVSNAEHYPAQREELAGAADRTAARVASLRQAANDGEALMAEIRASYPRSVWASVGDDRGVIADKVRLAGTLVSQAGRSASMEQQEWDQAQAMLAQANGDLDGVEGRLRAIGGLKDALDQAQHDAPEELAAAQSAVGQAQQAVQQLPGGARGAYAAAVDDLEQRLRGVLHVAAAEQPDILQVVMSAHEIRSAAGAVAAQARAERERIDRDEENRRALARSVMTSVLINAALSGSRSGRRGGGPRGGSRGGSSGFGGGGSSGWGGSGGGGGSSKW